jgi:hypothetical protein
MGIHPYLIHGATLIWKKRPGAAKKSLLTANRKADMGMSLTRTLPRLAGIAVSRCTQKPPKSYFSEVDRLLNVLDRLVPTAVTPVMMTTAIKAAIRPYSMAVAPDSFFRKARMVLRMVVSVWKSGSP